MDEVIKELRDYCRCINNIALSLPTEASEHRYGLFAIVAKIKAELDALARREPNNDVPLSQGPNFIGTEECA